MKYPNLFFKTLCLLSLAGIAYADNEVPQIVMIKNELYAPIDIEVKNKQCLSPSLKGNIDNDFFIFTSPLAGKQSESFDSVYSYVGPMLGVGTCDPLGPGAYTPAQYTIVLKDHHTGAEIGYILYHNPYDDIHRNPVCNQGILTSSSVHANYKLNTSCNFVTPDFHVTSTISYAYPNALLNFNISSDPNSQLTFTKIANETNPDVEFPDISKGSTVTASYTSPDNQSADGKFTYGVKDSAGTLLSGMSCSYSYHWNADKSQCSVDAPVATNTSMNYQVLCPAAETPVLGPTGCVFTIKNLLSTVKTFNLNINVQNSINKLFKLKEESGKGIYTNGPARSIDPISASSFIYATTQADSNLDIDYVSYMLDENPALACKFSYAIDTGNKKCSTQPIINQPVKVQVGDVILNCETLSADYNNEDNSCAITFNIAGEERRKFSVNLTNATQWDITRNSILIPSNTDDYQNQLLPPQTIEKDAPAQTFVYTPFMSIPKAAKAEEGICADVAGKGNACVAYDVPGLGSCELKYGWDTNNKCYATFTPVNVNPGKKIQCNMSAVQANAADCSVAVQIDNPVVVPLTKINLTIINALFTDTTIGDIAPNQPYQPMPGNIEDGQSSILSYTIPSNSINSGSQTLIYHLLNMNDDVSPVSCQLTFSWDKESCYGEAIQIGGNNSLKTSFTSSCKNMSKFVGKRNSDNSCDLSFVIGLPVQ